jgi:integrase
MTVENDGLDLPNPAAGLKPGVPPRQGDPEILDPRPLLKRKKLSVYWKALTAAMGLAGLRLAEAASLKWEMLQWPEGKKEGIIKLRASPEYPQMKNSICERDIKPFSEFWAILETYRQAAKDRALIFPKPDGKTWLESSDEARPSGELSKFYKAALESATGKTLEEPARQLRRFWVTYRRLKGLAHLDPISGGHSAEVGMRHYTRYQALVEGTAVGALGK